MGNGIWGNHLGYGIWGVEIISTKFTYCQAFGAPLLLLHLQTISAPIYVL